MGASSTHRNLALVYYDADRAANDEENVIIRTTLLNNCLFRFYFDERSGLHDSFRQPHIS